MKKEYSAGGVVYRKFQDLNFKFQIKYLLGKHSGYHKWVLPKGMIEAGETAEVTAVREVKEEMGIEAKIINETPLSTEHYTYRADFKEKANLRRVQTYQESGGGKTLVNKTVTWFLMEWVNGEPNDHDWEMEEGDWFTFEEAMTMLAFEGEKAALRQAQGKLSKSA